LNGDIIQIEFFFLEEMWFDNFDELYLVSSIDTVAFVNGIEIIPNEIFVLDQDDLAESFEYNPEGDQFYIIDEDEGIVSYIEYEMFRFGNFPGANIPVPDENQSIAIQRFEEIGGYNEVFYYIGLEQTPSIGYDEFNINARGVLIGNIVDLNNNPIPDVEISFPYFDQFYAMPSFTDIQGSFIMSYLLSANHVFNFFIGDYSDYFFATIYPYDTTYVEIQLDTLLEGIPQYYNHPNPFNGLTSFTVQIPDEINFKTAFLKIYNLNGKLVDQIEIPSSKSSIKWDGVGQKPGIYLYNITLDNKPFATQKMIIL
jgi:hypothetical protein